MHKAECSLSLDELLRLDGVVAAGMFSPDGKRVDYKDKMNTPKEMAQMTAKFCGIVNMLFEALASAYTQLYKMNCVPQHSFDIQRWRMTVIVAAGEEYSSKVPRQFY